MLVMPINNMVLFFTGQALSLLAEGWIGTSHDVKSDVLMGLVVAAAFIGPLAIPLAFIPKRQSPPDP